MLTDRLGVLCAQKRRQLANQRRHVAQTILLPRVSCGYVNVWAPAAASWSFNPPSAQLLSVELSADGSSALDVRSGWKVARGCVRCNWGCDGGLPLTVRRHDDADDTTCYRVVGQLPEAVFTETFPQLQIFARDIHALRWASRGGAAGRPSSSVCVAPLCAWLRCLREHGRSEQQRRRDATLEQLLHSMSSYERARGCKQRTCCDANQTERGKWNPGCCEFASARRAVGWRLP